MHRDHTPPPTTTVACSARLPMTVDQPTENMHPTKVRDPDLAHEIAALRRENIALIGEVTRLQTSLRFQGASILADATRSPAAALAVPGRLFGLAREVFRLRAWHALTFALECGLPNDPLHSMVPPDLSRYALMRRMARRASRNAAPIVSAGTSSVAGPLELAGCRHRELEDIIEKGPAVCPEVGSPGLPRSHGPVLMVLDSGAPDLMNGYTMRSQELLRAIRGRSIDAIGLIRSLDPQDADQEIDDVPYYRLPLINQDTSITSYLQKYSSAIEQVIRSCRPRLVHAASNHVTGYSALLAARKVGLPFIYEVRGLWEMTRASIYPRYAASAGYAAQRRMEIETARNADWLLVNGDGLKALFVEAGVRPERISIVPNGCVPEDFDAAATLAPELKTRWGLDSRPIIGFVGSLTSYEGLGDLVAACARLKHRIDFQLLIVGDGPYRPELEADVARAGVRAITRFVGRVSPEEARAAYAIIDIAPLVRPATPVARLTPPLKPLEAMAGGSALVVSNLPALRAFADDDRGIVVPPSDPSTLEDALGSLLADEQKRVALAAKARRHVETKLRWSNTAQTITTIYEKLTG